MLPIALLASAAALTSAEQTCCAFFGFTIGYMWLRGGYFVRAWTKFLSKVQTDSWAEQAKAERGAGHAHRVPALVLIASFIALGWSWFQMPTMVQSTILWLGWPVLLVVTVAQTVVMASKLLRRQRGYWV